MTSTRSLVAIQLAIAELFVLACVAASVTDKWSLLLLAPLVALLLPRCRLAFREGSAFWLLRPDGVILFTLVVYFVPSVLDVEFGANVRQVSQQSLVLYLILADLFAFAVFLGTRSLDTSISAFLRRQTQPREEPDLHGFIRFVAILILASGGVLYLYFVSTSLGGIQGMLSMTREQYYANLRENGFYAAGLTLLRSGWLVLFAIDCVGPHSKRRIVWHVVLFAVFCLFFLAAGERSTWFRLFAGMAFLLFWARRFDSKTIAVLAFTAVIGLHGFSSIRYALDRPDVTLVQAASRASWLDFSRGETGAHLLVAEHVLTDPELNQTRFGTTYAGSVANLVPLKLWPRREEYVISPEREHLAKYYADRPPSFGMGYSFITESFLNFWYFGPLIVGFLLGRVFGWFYRRLVLSRSSCPVCKAAYATALPVLLLLPRMPFAATLKILVISTAIPFGMLLLALAFVRRRAAGPLAPQDFKRRSDRSFVDR